MDAAKEKQDMKERAEAWYQKRARDLVPSELKWDAQGRACGGNALKQLGVGVLVGACVSALLVPRRPSLRAAVTATGAGIGLGRAWEQCSQQFEELRQEMAKPPASSE